MSSSSPLTPDRRSATRLSARRASLERSEVSAQTSALEKQTTLLRRTGNAAATSGERATGALARRTELVLREIEQLPTLPTVAAKLLALASRDDVDVREIVRLIETDPSLTAKLLAMCRKASTRTRVPITTVEMAVVMLGLEAVRALVLSVEIFEWSRRMERADDGIGREPGQGTALGAASTRPGGRIGHTIDVAARFSRVGFWQHSIAVACAADLIARECGAQEFRPEEAFVCGLVHDLGKLALEWVLPKSYARVTELAVHHRGDACTFERTVLGLDHSEAGVRLVERWGLPEIVRDAIGMHHAPFATAPENGGAKMARVVGIADALCRRLGLGWSNSLAGSEAAGDACASIGLTIDRVDALAPKLFELATARCRELGLGEEPSLRMLVESVLRANARLGRLNEDLSDANRAIDAAQSQLAEARTLARLGQMTAGAAHEMNNPLAVISGRAQGLLTRVRDEKERVAVQSIVEASHRLTGLISRLHRIAAPPQPVAEPVDIGELLTDVISRARARHAARLESGGFAITPVSTKLALGTGISVVRVDRELMSDALLEIVVNALESRPRSGVTVRARGEEDGWIRLEISDDGVGMSDKALAHAMDPFFSDKPAGRQPGLGLALADRLVRLHDGEIVMSSSPGKGTTVSVRLPAWRNDGRANLEDSAASLVRPGTPRRGRPSSRSVA